MAAASIVNFKIEVHGAPFAEDEECLICFEGEGELTSSGGSVGSLGNRQVSVILSGPGKIIGFKELVHLSCHPNQAYHYGCLEKWLAENASYPLDRNQVDPAVQSQFLELIRWAC